MEKSFLFRQSATTSLLQIDIKGRRHAVTNSETPPICHVGGAPGMMSSMATDLQH
ncbi:hypothetical protein SJ05684_c03330 [Sinorhizobium sojae CCBAU 05684]|uniref:Uncharacterized protein n=1 Tax=Sinorhizobium sojae CCBAU 05684 TaxID=716928 RepID=A0A249P793_9HYPH|nr:hypothetical protein SJ05684_c03330 [Sinorhizobium sojae CCBAU 05684]